MHVHKHRHTWDGDAFMNGCLHDDNCIYGGEQVYRFMSVGNKYIGSCLGQTFMYKTHHHVWGAATPGVHRCIHGTR